MLKNVVIVVKDYSRSGIIMIILMEMIFLVLLWKVLSVVRSLFFSIIEVFV